MKLVDIFLSVKIRFKQIYVFTKNKIYLNYKSGTHKLLVRILAWLIGVYVSSVKSSWGNLWMFKIYRYREKAELKKKQRLIAVFLMIDLKRRLTSNFNLPSRAAV